jgi:hypothetical protein
MFKARKLNYVKYGNQLNKIINKMVEYMVTNIMIYHDPYHYFNGLESFIEAFSISALFMVHTKELSLLDTPYEPILLDNKSIIMTKEYEREGDTNLNVCIGTKISIINDSLLDSINHNIENYNRLINSYVKRFIDDPYRPVNVNVRNKYELVCLIKALNNATNDHIEHTNSKYIENGHINADLNLQHISNNTLDVALSINDEVENRRRC